MITELFDEDYFPRNLKKQGKKPDEYVSVTGIKKDTRNISYGMAYAYSYFQCEAGLIPGIEKNLIQKDFGQEQSFSKDFFLPDSPDTSESSKDKWENLPPHSWFLSIKFKLQEPFLSHGDDPFYPVENSVCRDGSSGLPMIKSTTWKGNFLDAFYRLQPFKMSSYFEEIKEWTPDDWKNNQTLLCDSLAPRAKEIFEEHGCFQDCPFYAVEELYNIAMKKEREWLFLRKNGNLEEYQKHPLTILHRFRGYAVQWLRGLCGTDDELYGDKKQFHLTLKETKYDEKQCPSQGNLFFFPSYFYKLDYDIIAPVERAGRTVKNPIPIEMIPSKELGEFCLFYLADANPTQEKEKSAKNLSLCLEIIEIMLEQTGFSAKKNTGYGQAEIISIKCYGNDVPWGEKEKEDKISFQMDSRYKAFFVSDKVNSPHSLEFKKESTSQKDFLEKKADKVLDKLPAKERKTINKNPQEKDKWLKNNGFNVEQYKKEWEEELDKCRQWLEEQKTKYPIPKTSKISSLSFITIAECIEKLASIWRKSKP